jgi:hypothetical protein
MSADRFEIPYQEGALKKWLRLHCASKESRLSLPKRLCWRERRIMRALCFLAAFSLLLAIALGELGYPFVVESASMALCLFWCAWAGLYETASGWQRMASLWMVDSAAPAKPPSSLPDPDTIGMADTALDLKSATGEEIAEALRRELGGE